MKNAQGQFRVLKSALESRRAIAKQLRRSSHLPAASVGKNKLDVRWMDGVWPGIKLESVESIIGTADGVVKA